MQIYTCPTCGARPETEFHYGGDRGNVRPEGFRSVSDADWAAYLYFRNNHKGAAQEIWVHLTCGEFFVMERDTVSHAVKASIPLHGNGDAA